VYSGSTLTNKSGNLLGAHQKINRIARQALKSMLKNDKSFPTKKLLLHFEGKNGPDGMKKKSIADDQWHFYDPFDSEDTELLQVIDHHFNNLVIELKSKNQERAAFEASWLAHAIVDGLTPAHQYPYEQQLNKLHGNTKVQRNTVLKRVLAPGNTTIQIISKNWKIWGSKGLLTNHVMFEMGAATIIRPLPRRIAYPSRYDIKTIEKIGLIEYFKRTAREVALLDIYDLFSRRGWTTKVTKLVKKELAPKMAVCVTLAWYLAAKNAGLTIPIK